MGILAEILGNLLGLLLLLFPADSAVTLESFESRTDTGQPVYNRIRLIAGKAQDTWLMQQSHAGYHESFGQWDLLAIVIDKTGPRKTARFFQLKPGRLAFETAPVPYRARCYACHANGPRAIRWNAKSAAVVPSAREQALITLWNLRIKSYGPVDSLPGAKFSEGASFRSDLPIFKRPLGIATCARCHGEGKIRNPLTLEQVGTAAFQVERGLMPPFPFRATEEERRQLAKLVH